MNGKPGIYIIYSKPNNGITYNSTPLEEFSVGQDLLQIMTVTISNKKS